MNKITKPRSPRILAKMAGLPRRLHRWATNSWLGTSDIYVSQFLPSMLSLALRLSLFPGVPAKDASSAFNASPLVWNKGAQETLELRAEQNIASRVLCTDKLVLSRVKPSFVCRRDAGSLMEFRKRTVGIVISTFALIVAGIAQDPGWPRQVTKQGTKLVYYQPQIDDWKDFKELDGRMAISLTPAGGKQTVGVLSLTIQTDTDIDNHNVILRNPKITRTYFPSLSPEAASSMDQLVRTFLPPTYVTNISLDRLVASVHKPKVEHTAPVKNDPPTIFISYVPAILLSVPGTPVKTPVEDTKLDVVVNANWPLFFDKSSSGYYLFDGKGWLMANSLDGPWKAASQLPKDMSKVGKDPNWADLKQFIPPPPGSTGQVPQVFYSGRPAEVIVFKGQPTYAKIPATGLVYATNSDSPLFVYSPAKAYYYLTAGRWFSAPSLMGPWIFATDKLPADFKKIPTNSPVAGILASVPGTSEAEDAVLLAQIPTTAIVNPTEAAAKVKVSYSGDPQFKPIEGTSLSYAANTSDKVIKVGDMYYVCFQGVWFMSTSPQGPWQTAKSVPQEIYTIPPGSPVYNVTYVTQVETSDGNIESSYTAGYLGMFITGAAVGAIIANGTGYYYPPYVGFYGVHPVYYPYAATYGYHAAYNPYTGVYGYGHTVYGPYGGGSYGARYNPYTGTYARGATAYGPYGSRSAGQAYNPYTGTYARGASASTAYGSRSAGQAYNPYTGAYGATRQGSNAYSNWGSSVATRNGQTAYSQHYSSAKGSVGSVQTSSGGKAVAGTSAYGGGYAGKTSSGDMYAGHDGNVYKNTGSGWQQYNNGSWNNVNKPTQVNQANVQKAQSSFQQSAATRTSSDQFQSLNQEAQNRQRGAAQSQHFESARSSWSGGSRSFSRRR
jgi:hypothetical protein